ncbi:hypothetical protein Sliba_15990 [Streptomyces nigrescens]|uniref:Uncharacterized protein n=1 Tax=Streptomyces nigrescens TaxID=1920 RepID=A0A640TFY8_STRNI|nr:hypothetical protein Sliba_15990 [Streptomyces libani subsp. libani]GGW03037.1 hypothetical protein GCM10010500_62040 [Streptomyces libani subsp. libani]
MSLKNFYRTFLVRFSPRRHDAVVRMIEEWLQRSGHLAPRPFAAEAPHLGERETLSLSQTPPERSKAAVGPGDIRAARVSIARKKNQPHAPSLPCVLSTQDRRDRAGPATEMISAWLL